MNSQDEPTNHADTLLILTWLFMSLTIITMFLRLWTRICILHAHFLYSHDALMLVATILQIGQSTMLTLAYAHGLGRHYTTFTPAAARNVVLFSEMAEPFGVLGPMAGRISVVVLLMQVLLPHERLKRITLWSLIVLQTVVNVYVVIELLGQCGSYVEAVWDFYYPKATAHCLSPSVLNYSSYVQVAVCAFSDLVLTLLPILMLRRMDFRTLDRWALTGILSLSLFAFAAAIVRATQIGNLAKTGDFTWYFPNFMICVIIENNIIIIAGSMPTLRPFWKHLCSLKRQNCGQRGPHTGAIASLPRSGREMLSMQHQCFPRVTSGTSGSMIWTISTAGKPGMSGFHDDRYGPNDDHSSTITNGTKKSFLNSKRFAILGSRSSSTEVEHGRNFMGASEPPMRMTINRTLSVDVRSERVEFAEPLPNFIAPWVNDGPTSEVSISTDCG
ncbi:hypothetical protein K431DRAFT_98504 [Polychaeton citri CBS 116435]|uniref:Rhodopsin domain-containing protein n=1 Tax=Polychaeton citri CBS 116435 TaxID=1314669 RepID=A0A9P4QF94_9PEZI|nr:hypothetical protein K431DRAFT_98504 [Polychaeton citri CBS 116435]